MLAFNTEGGFHNLGRAAGGAMYEGTSYAMPCPKIKAYWASGDMEVISLDKNDEVVPHTTFIENFSIWDHYRSAMKSTIAIEAAEVGIAIIQAATVLTVLSWGVKHYRCCGEPRCTGLHDLDGSTCPMCVGSGTRVAWTVAITVRFQFGNLESWDVEFAGRRAVEFLSPELLDNDTSKYNQKRIIQLAKEKFRKDRKFNLGLWWKSSINDTTKAISRPELLHCPFWEPLDKECTTSVRPQFSTYDDMYAGQFRTLPTGDNQSATEHGRAQQTQQPHAREDDSAPSAQLSQPEFDYRSFPLHVVTPIGLNNPPAMQLCAINALVQCIVSNVPLLLAVVASATRDSVPRELEKVLRLYVKHHTMPSAVVRQNLKQAIRLTLSRDASADVHAYFHTLYRKAYLADGPMGVEYQWAYACTDCSMDTIHCEITLRPWLEVHFGPSIANVQQAVQEACSEERCGVQHVACHNCSSVATGTGRASHIVTGDFLVLHAIGNNSIPLGDTLEAFGRTYHCTGAVYSVNNRHYYAVARFGEQRSLYKVDDANVHTVATFPAATWVLAFYNVATTS